MSIEKGKNVTLQVDLRSANLNIRPDEKTFALNTVIPKGTSGVVKEVQPDEILVELYVNPSNIPGHGSGSLVWIKRYVYGQYFE